MANIIETLYSELELHYGTLPVRLCQMFQPAYSESHFLNFIIVINRIFSIFRWSTSTGNEAMVRHPCGDYFRHFDVSRSYRIVFLDELFIDVPVSYDASVSVGRNDSATGQDVTVFGNRSDIGDRRSNPDRLSVVDGIRSFDIFTSESANSACGGGVESFAIRRIDATVEKGSHQDYGGCASIG